MPFQTLRKFWKTRVCEEPGLPSRRKCQCPAARLGESRSWSYWRERRIEPSGLKSQWRGEPFSMEVSMNAKSAGRGAGRGSGGAAMEVMGASDRNAAARMA